MSDNISNTWKFKVDAPSFQPSTKAPSVSDDESRSGNPAWSDAPTSSHPASSGWAGQVVQHHHHHHHHQMNPYANYQPPHQQHHQGHHYQQQPHAHHHQHHAHYDPNAFRGGYGAAASPETAQYAYPHHHHHHHHSGSSHHSNSTGSYQYPSHSSGSNGQHVDYSSYPQPYGGQPLPPPPGPPPSQQQQHHSKDGTTGHATGSYTTHGPQHKGPFMIATPRDLVANAMKQMEKERQRQKDRAKEKNIISDSSRYGHIVEVETRDNKVSSSSKTKDNNNEEEGNNNNGQQEQNEEEQNNNNNINNNTSSSLEARINNDHENDDEDNKVVGTLNNNKSSSSSSVAELNAAWKKFRVMYRFPKVCRWKEKLYTAFGRQSIRHINFIHLEGRTSHTDGSVDLPAEFVDGGSLERYLEIFDELLADKSLEEKERADLLHHRLQFCKGVALQLLEAVYYLEFVLANSSSTPHRNISPKTILIRSDGCVKLRPSNFLDKENIKHNKYHFLEHGYVEEASRFSIKRRLSTDFKNDIWAIGAVAYSIMTNTSLLPPWKEEDKLIGEQHLQQQQLLTLLYEEDRKTSNLPSNTFNKEMDHMVLGNMVCHESHQSPAALAEQYADQSINPYVSDGDSNTVSANTAAIIARLRSLRASPVYAGSSAVKRSNGESITSSDVATAIGKFTFTEEEEENVSVNTNKTKDVVINDNDDDPDQQPSGLTFSIESTLKNDKQQLVNSNSSSSKPPPSFASANSIVIGQAEKALLSQLHSEHVERNQKFYDFASLPHDNEKWKELFPDEGLCSFVQKCLTSNPESRPNSAEALAHIFAHSQLISNDNHEIKKLLHSSSSPAVWQVLKSSFTLPNNTAILKYLQEKSEAKKYTSLEFFNQDDEALDEKNPNAPALRRRQLKAEIERLNRMPIPQIACNRDNLHALLTLKENLVCVPYPTQGIYESSISFRAMNAQRRNEGKPIPPCKSIFIGQMPLVVNENLISLLIKAVAGVDPIKIIVTPAAKNSGGKVTSPLVVIDVPEKDVYRVLANLHRRVIVDQSAFYVAVTDEQALILHRFCKMLYRRPDIRFQHRPYTVATVTLANPEGTPRKAPPVFNNQWNPLCTCSGCRAFYRNSLNYDYLMKTYLPSIIGNINPAQFTPENIVETHAVIRDKSRLNPLQRELYCDVSESTRLSVTENTNKLWAKFREAPDKDDFWEMKCRDEMPDHGPINQGGKGLPPPTGVSAPSGTGSRDSVHVANDEERGMVASKKTFDDVDDQRVYARAPLLVEQQSSLSSAASAIGSETSFVSSSKTTHSNFSAWGAESASTTSSLPPPPPPKKSGAQEVADTLVSLKKKPTSSGENQSNAKSSNQVTTSLNDDGSVDIDTVVKTEETVYGWQFNDRLNPDIVLQDEEENDSSTTATTKSVFDAWTLEVNTLDSPQLIDFFEVLQSDKQPREKKITEIACLLVSQGYNFNEMRVNFVKEKNKEGRKTLEENVSDIATSRQTVTWFNCARALCQLRNGYLGFAPNPDNNSKHRHQYRQIENPTEARFYLFLQKMNEYVKTDYVPELLDILDKFARGLVLEKWLVALLKKNNLLEGFPDLSESATFLLKNQITPENFCKKLADGFFAEFLTPISLSQESQRRLTSAARIQQGGTDESIDEETQIQITRLSHHFPKGIIFSPYEIKIHKRLGQGTQGVVYDCITKKKNFSDVFCVIKICLEKDDNDTMVHKARFNYRALGCDNVVKLIGLSVIPPSQVSNYVSNTRSDGTRIGVMVEKTITDGEKLPYDKLSSGMEVMRIYKYSLDIANALAHFHRPGKQLSGVSSLASSNATKKTMLYLNLKPTNIQIAKDDTLKINCFNVFKEIDPSSFEYPTNLTKSDPKYSFGKTEDFTTDPQVMAPEVKNPASFHPEKRTLTLSPAYDVFSFGCFLYRMISGKKVVIQQENLVKESQSNEALSALEAQRDGTCGLHDPKQVMAFSNLIRVCHYCLKVKPELRPKNGIVLKFLLEEARKLDTVRLEKRPLKKVVLTCCDISPEDYESALRPNQKDHVRTAGTTVFTSMPADSRPHEYEQTVSMGPFSVTYKSSQYPTKIPNPSSNTATSNSAYVDDAHNNINSFNNSVPMTVTRIEVSRSSSGGADGGPPANHPPHLPPPPPTPNQPIDDLIFGEHVVDLTLGQMNEGKTVFIDVIEDRPPPPAFGIGGLPSSSSASMFMLNQMKQ